MRDAVKQKHAPFQAEGGGRLELKGGNLQEPELGW